MLGIVIDENQPEYERGDFLVRPIIGADPEAGTIAIGERVRVGQTVRMHVRDGASADEDLREALAAQAPALGLDRRRRRAAVHLQRPRLAHVRASPDHDATAVEDALGAPAGGFFCAGEIGPVGGPQLPARLHRDDGRLPAPSDGRSTARAGRPGARRGPRRRRHHLRGDRPGRGARAGADRPEAARRRLRPRRGRRGLPPGGRRGLRARSTARGSGATSVPADVALVGGPAPGAARRPSARRSTSSATSPASRP